MTYLRVMYFYDYLIFSTWKTTTTTTNPIIFFFSMWNFIQKKWLVYTLEEICYSSQLTSEPLYALKESCGRLHFPVNVQTCICRKGKLWQASSQLTSGHVYAFRKAVAGYSSQLTSEPVYALRKAVAGYSSQLTSEPVYALKKAVAGYSSQLTSGHVYASKGQCGRLQFPVNVRTWSCGWLQFPVNVRTWSCGRLQFTVNIRTCICLKESCGRLHFC